MRKASQKETHMNHRRFIPWIAAALIACAAIAHAASETFVWLPNTEPDVAGYRIYYGTPPGKFNQVVDVGNVTRATITGLAPGNTYQFFATCYNTAGLESDPSNIVELTTNPNVPKAPGNLKQQPEP